MSGWLIGLVTLIYVGVSISFWREGNSGMALTFAGYSVANIGLILAAK